MAGKKQARKKDSTEGARLFARVDPDLHLRVKIQAAVNQQTMEQLLVAALIAYLPQR